MNPVHQSTALPNIRKLKRSYTAHCNGTINGKAHKNKKQNVNNRTVQPIEIRSMSHFGSKHWNNHDNTHEYIQRTFNAFCIYGSNTGQATVN